jgi:hypothetical protein
LWKDRKFAEELGRQGAAGVREHYSAGRMARNTIAVFEGLSTSKVATMS